jgi:hypothetical protein
MGVTLLISIDCIGTAVNAGGGTTLPRTEETSNLVRWYQTDASAHVKTLANDFSCAPLEKLLLLPLPTVRLDSTGSRWQSVVVIAFGHSRQNEQRLRISPLPWRAGRERPVTPTRDNYSLSNCPTDRLEVPCSASWIPKPVKALRNARLRVEPVLPFSLLES